MSKKLTRARKREIREEVRKIIADRISQLNVACFPAGPESEYAGRIVQEVVSQLEGHQTGPVLEADNG